MSSLMCLTLCDRLSNSLTFLAEAKAKKKVTLRDHMEDESGI